MRKYIEPIKKATPEVVDALSPGLTSENAHPQFGREPEHLTGVETDPEPAAPVESSFSDRVTAARYGSFNPSANTSETVQRSPLDMIARSGKSVLTTTIYQQHQYQEGNARVQFPGIGSDIDSA